MQKQEKKEKKVLKNLNFKKKEKMNSTGQLATSTLSQRILNRPFENMTGMMFLLHPCGSFTCTCIPVVLLLDVLVV